MEDVKNRKRSININNLTQQEADRIGEEIGAKVREFSDEACKKANEILNIYGLCAKMQIVIKPIDEQDKKSSVEEPKKKRGRKPKAANL